MKEEQAVYIESVADFLNALPEGYEFSDTLLDNFILYRGQSNKNWGLVPEVMRNREDFLNEELYIKECLRQYPDEFLNMDKIDMLIKMQHYGIPTRLLDLTSNPLVALYFACDSQLDEDGVVYATHSPIFRSTDLHISVVAECLFSHKSHGKIWSPKDGIQIGRESISHDDIERIVLENRTPFTFEAALSNPRIKNQNGFFALYRGAGDWKEIKHFKSIYVKKEHKEKIITQLSKIGIDSSFLFPELSNGASSIVSTIRKRNLQFNKQFYTAFDKIGTVR